MMRYIACHKCVVIKDGNTSINCPYLLFQEPSAKKRKISQDDDKDKAKEDDKKKEKEEKKKEEREKEKKDVSDENAMI